MNSNIYLVLQHCSLSVSKFLKRNLVIEKMFLIVSTGLMLIPYSASTLADEINPGVYSKDSAPYGIPYGDWIAKWWNWTLSIPKGEHPREDFTPEKCSANQGGPVWFLADQLGGKEERTCTIPAGKAILIPLLTGECGYDSPETQTDESVRNCALEGQEFGLIEATIDGVKLENLQQYRTQSGFFNATQVENNIYDAPAGTFRGYADGYFVFSEPMPPGEHEVNLKVSVLNPINPVYNYNADWMYHIHSTNETNAG